MANYLIVWEFLLVTARRTQRLKEILWMPKVCALPPVKSPIYILLSLPQCVLVPVSSTIIAPRQYASEICWQVILLGLHISKNFLKAVLVEYIPS
jgi:hypothetical protein